MVNENYVTDVMVATHCSNQNGVLRDNIFSYEYTFDNTLSVYARKNVQTYCMYRVIKHVVRVIQEWEYK